ncbi:MAG: hypothetical protein KatS3mg101_0716 [Patescibacteria group bacterium]|nr:MAG: hypothetical protein KatS3mg101_0716 [Patescibacteria group bacterium]
MQKERFCFFLDLRFTAAFQILMIWARSGFCFSEIFRILGGTFLSLEDQIFTVWILAF